MIYPDEMGGNSDENSVEMEGWIGKSSING